MKVTMKTARIGLRNSTVRIPFRYGNSCLTRCPQAVVSVVIEVDGCQQEGFSGDCLPPGWFDKKPDRSFEEQIEHMLEAIRQAIAGFSEEMASPVSLFDAWMAVYAKVHAWAVTNELPPLVAAFGVSFIERALMDAIARHAKVSFDQAVRTNLFGIRPGDVHSQLEGRSVADWLPAVPREAIFVRHTVGLSDPLTVADIPASERLQDGWPQALEEYVQQTGTCYFKIKVSNKLDSDMQRLKEIAAIVEAQLGSGYQVTLDGNEQYKEPGQFDELVDSIRSCSVLDQLWENTLVVEQPLDRSIALDSQYTEGIRALCQSKPVVIDESDGRLEDYSKAIECGYRGVSSKNCKGPLKSLLNAGLTWLYNQQYGEGQYVMTGEDLCSVGIIPVQADLCLVATLGLSHVERNGHHFHPGLKYLPVEQQQAALEAHPDLYSQAGESVAPVVRNGQFKIGSLQCEGFGFAVIPEWKDYMPVDQWSFESLGLE